MDKFVVRTKRPIEASSPPSKKAKGSSSYSGGGGGYGGSSFKAASSWSAAHGNSSGSSSSSWRSSHAAAASSSFSSALQFTPGSPSSHHSAPLKQLAITQLSKVTNVEEVTSLCAFLRSALDKRSWSQVYKIAKQLQNIFISKVVLEKTDAGKLLTKVRKALQEEIQKLGGSPSAPAANAAANSPVVTAAASSATSAAAPLAPAKAVPLPLPLPVDDDENVDEEEAIFAAERGSDTVDLTSSRASSEADDEEADAYENKAGNSGARASNTAAAAAASSSSAAASSSCASSARSPSSTDVAFLSSTLKLVRSLIATWKEQAQKEIDAAKLTGAAGLGPALDFSAHSNLKSRVNAYKAFYYELALEDKPPERQSQGQGKGSKQPAEAQLAKEPEIAAVASELESSLFRTLRAHFDDERIRAKRGSSELLSASNPAAGGREIDEALALEPPRYPAHARALLMALRARPAWIAKLREMAAQADADSRKEVIKKMIAACPSFF